MSMIKNVVVYSIKSFRQVDANHYCAFHCFFFVFFLNLNLDVGGDHLESCEGWRIPVLQYFGIWRKE